jgi:hypothetical protein
MENTMTESELETKERIESGRQSAVDAIVMALEPLKAVSDEMEFDGYASDISMEFVEEHCKGRPLTEEEKEECPDHWEFIVEGKELDLWHNFIKAVEKLRKEKFPNSKGHHICWAMETP